MGEEGPAGREGGGGSRSSSAKSWRFTSSRSGAHSLHKVGAGHCLGEFGGEHDPIEDRCPGLRYETEVGQVCQALCDLLRRSGAAPGIGILHPDIETGAREDDGKRHSDAAGPDDGDG